MDFRRERDLRIRGNREKLPHTFGFSAAGKRSISFSLGGGRGEICIWKNGELDKNRANRFRSRGEEKSPATLPIRLRVRPPPHFLEIKIYIMPGNGKFDLLTAFPVRVPFRRESSNLRTALTGAIWVRGGGRIKPSLTTLSRLRKDGVVNIQ